MNEISLFDMAIVWVTAFFTLAAFSFLYRDNPLYKLIEHAYIGVSAGYAFYQALRSTIYPNLILYLHDGFAGTLDGQNDMVIHFGWRFGAAILGLLLLTRLLPRINWISRWPMALIIGAYAGLNIVGLTKANLIDQIHACYIPLFSPDMQFWPIFKESQAYIPTAFNHIVLLTGTVAAMIYFFFSMGHKGVMGKIGLYGIGIIMITFGATYGSIVLARISLLIGRVQVLHETCDAQHGYPPFVCAIIVIAIIVIWRLKFFKPDEEEK